MAVIEKIEKIYDEEIGNLQNKDHAKKIAYFFLLTRNQFDKLNQEDFNE